MGDSSALQIVIFREGTLVGSEVFLPGDYTVGRDSDCELVLSDNGVLDCHAFLSFRDGKIVLQDVGDSSILVNGKPSHRAEIRSIDDVTIGPFLLKFRTVGQKRGMKVSSKSKAPSKVATDRPSSTSAQAIKSRLSDSTLRVASSSARPAASAKPPVTAPRDLSSRPASSSLRAPQSGPMAGASTSSSSSRPFIGASARAASAAPDLRSESAEPDSRPSRLPGSSQIKPVGLPHSRQEASPQFKRSEPSQSFEQAASGGVSPEPEHSLSGIDVPGDIIAGPCLRVRVFWGKYAVSTRSFPFGTTVRAGPNEKRDVPVYKLDLPWRFALAKCEKSGWVVRVPNGERAYIFEPTGWKAAEGIAERKATRVFLDQGKLLRIGDASYSIELRSERVRRVKRRNFKDWVHSEAFLPFAMAMVFGVILGITVAVMPPPKETADFTPKQLRAIRAELKPPDKKKPEPKPEEKKKEEKKKEEVVQKPAEKPKKVEAPTEAPKVKATEVNKAIKAVQKLTAAPAVESLLKATSKIAAGPKGYGDKGMGPKLSPLIGKPPMPMAGMGFGQGLGGFGAQTKGLGGMRGMGGAGGGIGSFAAGSTGKGKVAGVVSAPSAGFKQRGGGGALARELIAKVINDHLGEVRGCYERALLKEAGLMGKLVLEWTIDLNGTVTSIKVNQATLKSPDVQNCIVSSLKTWVFPKPTGGSVVVSYPFLFSSVGF